MNLDITTYEPVTTKRRKGCDNCGDKNVTWHQNDEGAWKLCEVFQLDDEEVFSPTDLHLRYCTKPRFAWKAHESEADPAKRRIQRQAEIFKAAAEYFGDSEPEPEYFGESEPESEPESEITHDGHPFCCEMCGNGIVSASDGLWHDYSLFDSSDEVMGKPHSCPSEFENHVANRRAVGTRVAKNVKFKDISERMDSVQRMMDESIGGLERAELAAEYLMLRKRLYTEIPS